MRRALLVPLILAVGAAQAAYPDRGGYVGAFYVPTSTKDVSLSGNPQTDFDGDGFGAHAIVPLGKLFAVTGEYQRSNHDDADTDQFRVGGGVQSSPDKARLLAYGEYVNIDLPGSASSSGFGLHLRGTLDVMPQLSVFGQVGYLNVSANDESTDGPEFLAGASWAFTELIGAFVDYRITRIATGNDDRTRFDDLRTGVRIYLTR
jgi:hypothetical protein